MCMGGESWIIYSLPPPAAYIDPWASKKQKLMSFFDREVENIIRRIAIDSWRIGGG